MVTPSLEKLVREIKLLLADDEIEQAIEQLKNYLHSNVPDLYNEVLIQSSRYSRLRRGHRAGLIAGEQFDVDKNRIARSLLELVDELPAKVERKLSPLGSGVPLISAAEAIPAEITPEKILGINNLKQISWIERGLEVARSVCRILTPKGLGTGFLVGHDLIMTNNHVIGDSASAADSVAEFNYQQDSAGQLLPTFRYRLDPTRFRTSPELDYTLVGVKAEDGKPPLASWGALSLNPNADPLRGEHVVIVQHPNGGLKQIVLTSNWVVATKPRVLHYTTDTMPGSSGSPVFNDSWHVIAIHHAAVPAGGGSKHRYVNEGILMSAIKPHAGDLWPGSHA